ncbi:MAG: hypothetical protein D5S03_09415 [Desulfonatronospira sp. MSAO_Bac3]|nr:MAG: hypothetical protein D5S03_09415 [Desulfonatronospira sp. MSAO_Bac3]
MLKITSFYITCQAGLENSRDAWLLSQEDHQSFGHPKTDCRLDLLCKLTSAGSAAVNHQLIHGRQCIKQPA